MTASLRALGIVAAVLVTPLFAFAENQVITLAPGWNIVSTPKVLESHAFSASETSENFDIYVLDASNPSGWTTMAVLGQSEFTPLWGYFVNNKTGASQTLILTHADDLNPNEKLFERTFSTSGWYSIGVANPTYAKSALSLAPDANNPSQILSLLNGNYDLVIDFTDAVFASDRASVALSDPWKAVGPTDVNTLNDLRETKGYVVYVKTAGAKYSGFQTEVGSGGEEEVALIMGEGSENPLAGNVEVDDSVSSEVTLVEFTLQAEGADIVFDQFIATTTGTGIDQMSDMVDSFHLMRGNTRIAEVAADNTTATQALVFDLEDQEYLATDGTATYRIVAEVHAIGAGTGDDTVFDQGDGIQVQSLAPLSGFINATVVGGGEVSERTGSATTYQQTLFSAGIMVTKVGESFVHNAADVSTDSTGEFRVTLRVTAFGSEDVYIPLSALATTAFGANATAGIVFGMQNSSTAIDASVVAGVNSATLARVSGGTELTNSVRISAGQSADLQLTITFNPQTGGTQQHRVQVWSVGSGDTDSSAADMQTATIPVENFRSSYYTINN